MAGVSVYEPFPAAHGPDGHLVGWAAWGGGEDQTATIRWENEGFTVVGKVSRERIEYVLRLTPTWKVSQFLLFRDLEEPDLWLATDGHGRWGEMNGAHLTELDGCYDVDLACTPFTNTLPIRRLPLLEGHAAELPVVSIDPETLEVRVVRHLYARVRSHRWSDRTLPTGAVAEFDVDEHGLVIDQPGLFRRVIHSDDS